MSSLLFGLLSALFSSGTTAAAFVLNDVYASLHTPIATIAPRLTHGIEGSPSENPLRQLVTDVNDNMADVSNLALPRLSWQCISRLAEQPLGKVYGCDINCGVMLSTSEPVPRCYARLQQVLAHAGQVKLAGLLIGLCLPRRQWGTRWESV